MVYAALLLSVCMSQRQLVSSVECRTPYHTCMPTVISSTVLLDSQFWPMELTSLPAQVSFLLSLPASLFTGCLT